MEYETSTIAAIATPVGVGAIGIVRLSGPLTKTITEQVCGSVPPPRVATLRIVKDNQSRPIDECLVLFFPGPRSFSGEDMVEFQCHGGVVILETLLQTLLDRGAVLASPGEFSERAFLNGRLDLTQAEAIADLIEVNDRQALQSAFNSLKGVFSSRVSCLEEKLMKLRVWLESQFDFSDEPVEKDKEAAFFSDLKNWFDDLNHLLSDAEEGERLSHSPSIALLGSPNSGKSTLLNALTGSDLAIVTDIPGTTRDLIRAEVIIQGMHIKITDTAGLRKTEDLVEQEGINRTLRLVEGADLVFFLQDASSENDEYADKEMKEKIPADKPVWTIFNKMDLMGAQVGLLRENVYGISALTGAGLEYLRNAVALYFQKAQFVESPFLARKRHLEALKKAADYAENGLARKEEGLEFLAEDLRQAHEWLGKITGRVTTEDLLGEIFSTFCIGK